MKVVLIAALTAGTLLSALVVFDAVQVPTAESVFGDDVSWLGSTGAALAGLEVTTSVNGRQVASPTDWIVGDGTSPVEVLGDDAFKAKYAEAPAGAGVPETVEQSLDQAAALPQYLSHKIVRAGAIVSVDSSGTEPVVTLNDPNVPTLAVPADTFSRYTPVEGDYLVVYDDGYMSVSPKAAFEDGYSLVVPDPTPAPAEQQAA